MISIYFEKFYPLRRHIFWSKMHIFLFFNQKRHKSNALILVIDIPITQTITPFDFTKMKLFPIESIHRKSNTHTEKYKVSMEFQTKQTRNPIKYGETITYTRYSFFFPFRISKKKKKIYNLRLSNLIVKSIPNI